MFNRLYIKELEHGETSKILKCVDDTKLFRKMKTVEGEIAR